MIAVVDFGAGNPRAFQNMFSRIGVLSVITADPSEIEAAESLILPGVGAFDNAMENLRRRDLVRVLNRQVLEKKVPILGVCLGMQLFSKRSEEGHLAGLGWIDAETVRFRFPPECKKPIPHMGWDRVEVQQASSILSDRFEDSRYYFVHSYHVRCNRESNVLATTSYGTVFHSAIIQENIIGTQFHPEKSHKYGIRLLANFARGGA